MARSSDKKPPADFHFFTDQEYRRELLNLIKKTKKGDRLMLMSMSFEPAEAEFAEIADATEGAAARGVRVTMGIDAHSFMVHADRIWTQIVPRLSLPRLTPYYQKKLGYLERINDFPESFAEILNVPERFPAWPVAGRSHIKVAIVNTRIFVGGCNLQGADAADMMVGWESKSDSDMLFAVLRQVIHGKSVRRSLAGSDRSLNTSDESKVLIDSGKPRQSRIFEEALQLIDEAENWLVITCQFFPGGITARHLLQAANRGVDVKIIYTHPSKFDAVDKYLQNINVVRERTRIPKSLFAAGLSRDDPFLHAKLIACDKGVMIGSHNYVQSGVSLGTAEIALRSSSEKLAHEAVKTVYRSLEQKSAG